MNFGICVMWGIGVLMLLPLTLITLTKVNELAEVLFGRGPRRLITRTRRRAVRRSQRRRCRSTSPPIANRRTW